MLKQVNASIFVFSLLSTQQKSQDNVGIQVLFQVAKFPTYSITTPYLGHFHLQLLLIKISMLSFKKKSFSLLRYISYISPGTGQRSHNLQVLVHSLGSQTSSFSFLAKRTCILNEKKNDFQEWILLNSAKKDHRYNKFVF